MRRRKQVVFKLLGCVLSSPLRWRMLAMLLAWIGTRAVDIWATVLLARVAGALIDGLTRRDASTFASAMVQLSGVFAVLLVCVGLLLYFRMHLEIHVRTALTHPWLRLWLDEESIYRIEREQRVDNPDQRISEDLVLFQSITMELLLGLIATVGGLFAYSRELWMKGGAFEFSLAGHNWSLPGYLFWLALIYSVVNLVLTRRIARRQIELNIQQQHVEADFRFSMAQLRDHAEQVALYQGADTEFVRLSRTFEHVRKNWWSLIAYRMGLKVYESASGKFIISTATVLMVPRVLSGGMTVGTLGLNQSMFGNAVDSLNWFSANWDKIVALIAVVKRLQTLDDAIGAAGEASAIEVGQSGTPSLSLLALALDRPDGVALAYIGDVEVSPGQRWLVRGPSGVGKSTLLRAVAGLWPHGRGRILVPSASQLFLPQKSYLPWDTLKAVTCYPMPEQGVSDDACGNALEQCGLPHLVPSLHHKERWAMRLSPGEQQRLAFARVLLNRPDFLFLDESTSALDVDTERHLYSLVIERLPTLALVSVAHRPTLESFHTHGLRIANDGPARIEMLKVPV